MHSTHTWLRITWRCKLVYGIHRPSVSQTHCVPGPLCHMPVVSQGHCVTDPLCTRPIVSHAHCVPVPLCHMPIVYQSHCVTCPFYTSPFVYQSHCVTCPLCTSPFVSHAHFIPVSLCTSPIAPQAHCVTCPLCTSPIVYQCEERKMWGAKLQLSTRQCPWPPHLHPHPLLLFFIFYFYFYFIFVLYIGITVAVPLCVPISTRRHLLNRLFLCNQACYAATWDRAPCNKLVSLQSSRSLWGLAWSNCDFCHVWGPADHFPAKSFCRGWVGGGGWGGVIQKD